MERAKTLVEKLLKQMSDGRPKAELQATLQMLQLELASLPDGPNVDDTVTVQVPTAAMNLGAARKAAIAADNFVGATPQVPGHSDQPSAAGQSPATEASANLDEPLRKLQPVAPDETAQAAATAIAEVVSMPAEPKPELVVQTAQLPEEPAEAPTYAVLEVDEEELEEELEEIKRNAEIRNKLSGHITPKHLFDSAPDAAPLEQQSLFANTEPAQEINHKAPQAPSLNDKLGQQSATEVSHHLNTTPIKDLRKAISLNERFVIINELFKADEDMYERSIKTINNFSIYPEAEYWIRRELKLKLGWDEKSQLVREFDHLVRRRFSAV